MSVLLSARLKQSDNMTFLKPDIRGISVLYVSLSGAVSRYPLYLLWRTPP
ncbi:hypothetical protein [Flavobacterium sp. FlaQc-48]